MRKRTFIRRGCCLWLCLWAGVAWPAGETTKEYEVKAAFLLNFIQFVEWPATAFTAADAPLRIGVLGTDPFGSALDETVRGETIRDRKIVIRRAPRIEDLNDCQVVFICKSENAKVPDVLSHLDSRPVLSVSEVTGFASRGGTINFYREQNKVRFEINPAAARQNGLKISSQLLGLGKIVESDKK